MPPSASLPVPGLAAAAGEQIRLAPGPDGTLFVLIPGAAGTVVAFLDGLGRSQPGWPILLPGVSPCELLLRADDGSVRAVCREAGDRFAERPLQAFAFDADGRTRAGWPVEVAATCCLAGRVIGDDLWLVTQRYGTDVVASLTMVRRDGTVRRGAELRQAIGCGGWTVGPDGIAYGTGCENTSQAMALEMDGLVEGWPLSYDGIASAPEFAPSGRAIVVVGPFAGDASRVLAFEGGGKAVLFVSRDLPISTVRSPELGDVDCARTVPLPPIVGGDGTIFVFSADKVVALEPSLAIRAGWPLDLAESLQSRYYVDPGHDGITCGSLAPSAVGAGGTLHVPLQARNGTVGGSIVAVGPDGRVRPGWPVELRRPGAEFWSAVVGGDGTVYALAIEPESNGGSSASVLAIAPDSTVRWTTTIIEP